MRVLMVTVVLLTSACSGGGIASTTSSDSVAVAPTATSTSKAPTTTTTTNSPAFELPTVSEEQASSYLLIAVQTLAPTEYALTSNNVDAFGKMLRDGTIATCRSLHAGESQPEAIWAGLQHAPDIGTPDDLENTTGPLVLALLFMTSGSELYCPQLAPDRAEFLDSWEQLVGR